MKNKLFWMTFALGCLNVIGALYKLNFHAMLGWYIATYMYYSRHKLALYVQKEILDIKKIINKPHTEEVNK